MKLTQKLLSLLHRVFDPDPEKFLALRVRYGGTMTWTVAEGVLTTSVVGGIGQGFAIDLTTVTITQLVAYIAARPGYQVLYVDSSGNQSLSARVLMDGTGNIAQSNGDHLYGYTSLVWAYFEAVGTELKAAKAQIPEAIKQMSVPTASSDWIDELGAYYGVPRLQGETDQSYGARIIAETVRPRANNVAMERAISYYTGQATKVTDVTIYGAGFPKYNGTITRNSAYQYQPLSTPKYGLFDVEIGYDLLGGTDQSAFADVVAGIVEKLRSAGTHMRALSMQSGAIYDTFTPPTDNSPMTIVATPVLTETLTAPTEGTFTFTGALTVMSDPATAPSEPQAFDAIKYNYCYNGLRTRNGAIKYAGNTLETNPVVSKEWSFLTGVLPPDVTVLRASTGTRYNQQGTIEVIGADMPRLDYDPDSCLPRGLLIEESRTNELLYSGDFTRAPWQTSNLVLTSSDVIAPDGKFAIKASCSTANINHEAVQSFLGATFTIGDYIATSVYAKAGERNCIQIRWVGGAAGITGKYANFDLTTGATAGNSFSMSTEKLANGWYRCLAVALIEGDGTAGKDFGIGIIASLADGRRPAMAGTGTDGVYLCEAQVELGAFNTSQIPTTTAAVTRAADLVSVNTLAPWYDPTEGTLSLWATDRQPSVGVTFALSIGTDSLNYVGLCYTSESGSIGKSYIKNADVGSSINDGGLGRSRIVVAWDGANMGLATDGTYRGTGVSAGAPPAASMRIGRGHYGGSVVTGYYRKITYWSSRFPDGTLPTLSATAA